MAWGAGSVHPRPPVITSLSGRQAQHLRGLAHHLDPVVQLGKDGVTEPVVRATREALRVHELVKVRLPQIEREERRAMAAELVRQTGALLAGEVGRVLVLFLRHPTKPKIEVPGLRMPKPSTPIARRRARPNTSRARRQTTK